MSSHPNDPQPSVQPARRAPHLDVDDPSFQGAPTALAIPVLDELANLLVCLAPDNWEAVTLSAAMVGALADVRLSVRSRSSVSALACPPELTILLESLRSSSHHPEFGTWFECTLTLTSAGHLGTSWDYANRPSAFASTPDEVWMADSRLFPRDIAQTPAWLAVALDAAPARTS